MSEIPRIRPQAKDPDDAVRELGPDAVRDEIEARIPGPLDWKKQFMVRRERLEELKNAEMIVPGLFAAGQYHVVCARANGGKTTIVMALCPEMVSSGYKVTYVNADISGTDALETFDQASDGGFDLLLPDVADGGLSMGDVVKHLIETAASDADLTGEVWVFDTLKKMTDLINKSQAKRLYETLRKLTAKGMTIIALAHTNKYDDANGKPVYEGTSDLRNDCDNLIYFIPSKNDDGTITVAVEPDKSRASLEKMSFIITRDREVSRTAFVDVAAINLAAKSREADQDIIEVIEEFLTETRIQSEIVARCREHGIGRKSTDRVLRDYAAGPTGEMPTGKYWRRQRRFQSNAMQFWKD